MGAQISPPLVIIPTQRNRIQHNRSLVPDYQDADVCYWLRIIRLTVCYLLCMVRTLTTSAYCIISLLPSALLLLFALLPLSSCQRPLATGLHCLPEMADDINYSLRYLSRTQMYDIEIDSSVLFYTNHSSCRPPCFDLSLIKLFLGVCWFLSFSLY